MSDDRLMGEAMEADQLRRYREGKLADRYGAPPRKLSLRERLIAEHKEAIRRGLIRGRVSAQHRFRPTAEFIETVPRGHEVELMRYSATLTA